MSQILHWKQSYGATGDDKVDKLSTFHFECMHMFHALLVFALFWYWVNFTHTSGQSPSATEVIPKDIDK